MSVQGWVGVSQAAAARKAEAVLPQADRRNENLEETWVVANPI